MAILRSSHVIILDDPTAAPDPQSEYDVYKLIGESVGNKLMIYVSNRLTSSRLLLFADGTIVKGGTHKSLIEIAPSYRNLFNLYVQYYIDQKVM